MIEVSHLVASNQSSQLLKHVLAQDLIGHSWQMQKRTAGMWRCKSVLVLIRQGNPETGAQAGSRDRAVIISVSLGMATESVQQDRAAAATAGYTVTGQAAH